MNAQDRNSPVEAPWQLGLLRTPSIGGERGRGCCRVECVASRGEQRPKLPVLRGLPAGASASWGTRWAWLGGLEAETLLGA